MFAIPIVISGLKILTMSQVFDLEMIKEVYRRFPERIAAARAVTNKPLTLAEKILAAKGVKSLLVEHEEELLEEDDDDLDDDLDEDEEDEDHDKFGFGALGEGIDADDLK